MPSSVYSCSMPNQMQCSFTCSITSLQRTLWLVSEQRGRKPTAITLHVRPWLSFKQEVVKEGAGWEGGGGSHLQGIGCI